MVDWVEGTADASVAERDSAYLPLRVPGTPDVFKEAAVSGFVTKDASGNVNIGAPAVGRRLTVGTSSDGNGIQITYNAAPTGSAGGSLVWNAVRNGGSYHDIAEFRAVITDGSATYSADLLFCQARSGAFQPRWIMSSPGPLLPATDNAQAFGGPSNRLSVIYAGTGSINTSDEREKTWRGGLSEVEYAAGRALMAELGFYQWSEEIDKKGVDGARLHFGARAQQVWAICADHGLAPKLRKNGKPDTGVTPIAFLCFDEWGEETQDEFEDVEIEVDEEISQPTGQTVEIDGKTLELSETVTRKAMRTERRATGGKVIRTQAGNRYGLRVDELNSFLIAVQARRQDELDARITALEA